ncbi:MAG: tRNA (adenosine(37)-N6)-threonylcarbamoyltransferase complex dimerization subunit type 1 TsaB [Sandaracinaceae bacterium]
MRVLALDTSTDLASVAVVVDGGLQAEVTARAAARHGETLLPLVAEALDRAGLGRREYDLVVVGLGPGSFTGTRIGVSTAKGLVLANDIPIVGVPTLRVLARAMPGAWMAAAVDAHHGEVFAALYQRRPDRGLAEVVKPFHRPPEEAARVLERNAPRPFDLAGSAVRRYPERFRPAGGRPLMPVYDTPRGALLALEGLTLYLSRGPDDRAALEPMYLRPSDAVAPRG